MKYPGFIIIIVSFILITSFKPALQQTSLDDYPVYNGNDLGVSYSPLKTIFKVWAPMASAVKLNLYAVGDSGEAINTLDLLKGNNGAWELTIKKDLKNKYYTFRVLQDD